MLLSIVVYLSIICNVYSDTPSDAATCTSCCSSPAGVPGIPGNHGNPGAQGTAGLKGDVGEKGNTGIEGENGPPGKSGPVGPKGVLGEKGEKGTRGDQRPSYVQYKSAFTVAFTSDPDRQPLSTMKYDTVITNVGNHYNTESGKFICTYPGVYIFYFTSQKSTVTGARLVTSIMKNNARVVSAYDTTKGRNNISNMVVLDLVVDDEVWTQPLSTEHNYYYSNAYKYCTFSGFLLYPLL